MRDIERPPGAEWRGGRQREPGCRAPRFGFCPPDAHQSGSGGARRRPWPGGCATGGGNGQDDRAGARHQRPCRIRPARHGQLRRARLPGFGKRRNAGLDRPGLRTLRAANRTAARRLHDPGIGRRHRGTAPGGRLRKAGAVRRVLRHQGGARVRRTLSTERGSTGARFGRAARTRGPVLGGHVQSDEAGVRRAVLGRRLQRHHLQSTWGHCSLGLAPAHTRSQRLGVRRHRTPPPRGCLERRSVEPDRRGRLEPGLEGAAAGLGAVGPARRPGAIAAPEPALRGLDPESAGHAACELGTRASAVSAETLRQRRWTARASRRRRGWDRRSVVRGHDLRRVRSTLAAGGACEDPPGGRTGRSEGAPGERLLSV